MKWSRGHVTTGNDWEPSTCPACLLTAWHREHTHTLHSHLGVPLLLPWMGLSHLQHKHRLGDKCKLSGQGIAVDCVWECVCGVITPSGPYQPTWPYLEELRGARSSNSQRSNQCNGMCGSSPCSLAPQRNTTVCDFPSVEIQSIIWVSFRCSSTIRTNPE